MDVCDNGRRIFDGELPLWIRIQSKSMSAVKNGASVMSPLFDRRDVRAFGICDPNDNRNLMNLNGF